MPANRSLPGLHFATSSYMAKPGKAPEVHTEHDSITFVMRVFVVEGYSSRLVLRCERTGGIFVSLRHPTPDNDAKTIKKRDPQ
jgi:hypothetical protein